MPKKVNQNPQPSTDVSVVDTALVSQTPNFEMEVTEAPLTDSEGRVQCGYHGCTKWLFPQGLGVHRAKMHGVISAKTAAKHEKRKYTPRRSNQSKNLKEPIQDGQPNNILPHTIYLTGYITHVIEQYCRGHEIPVSDVTSGVAEALHHQTRR